MVVKLKRRSGARKKQTGPRTAPARLLSRRPPPTAPVAPPSGGPA
jgi:hypothetical protein